MNSQPASLVAKRLISDGADYDGDGARTIVGAGSFEMGREPRRRLVPYSVTSRSTHWDEVAFLPLASVSVTITCRA